MTRTSAKFGEIGVVTERVQSAVQRPARPQHDDEAVLLRWEGRHFAPRAKGRVPAQGHGCRRFWGRDVLYSEPCESYAVFRGRLCSVFCVG